MSLQEYYLARHQLKISEKMEITNEDMEELREILKLAEDEGILSRNKEMVNFLKKKGVKLREYKWTELMAS